MTEDIITKSDHYLIDGEKFWRVTAVLNIVSKPELYRWFGKYGREKCDQIRERRAEIGTKLHSIIEKTLNNKEIGEIKGKSLKDSYNLFMQWYKQHELEPLYTEHHMKHDLHQYAGTCDYIGILDGKTVIIDWKTSKFLGYTYVLQLVAYYYMLLEEQPGLEIDEARIISFRDGKIQEVIIPAKEFPHLFDIFLCCLTVFKHKKIFKVKSRRVKIDDRS